MALSAVLRPGHVCLRVLDLEAALKHYRDSMGLIETARDAQGRIYLKGWDELDWFSVVLREAAQIAADHGLRLALEVNSQHDVINHIEVAREIIAKAAHPAAGLLIDAYHLQRSGSPGRGFEHVAPEEIFTFQYSDVPAGPPPGQRRPTDRLLPGEGIVQWQAVFELLREKGYGGYLSFEAPNPALWARPPAEVARAAAAAITASE